MRTCYVFISVLILAIILGGCTATPIAIEGAERDAVLTYTEPMADNELEALNANNYQAFIKDYDEKMLETTTRENFTSLYELLSSKLGKYVSREVTAVTAVGEDAILVVYRVKFEKEEGVTVRLIFQPRGGHLITGLWFDSPKLREK